MCIWWNGRTDKGDLDITIYCELSKHHASGQKYQIIKVNTPFFFKPKGGKQTYYCTIWTERVDGVVGLSSSIFLLPKQIEATFFYTSEDIKMVHKCPKMRENRGNIQHVNKTSTSSKQMINKTGIYMQMRTKESY